MTKLAKFFLEWEMLLTKVIETTKTHILCSVTFFRFMWCRKIWSQEVTNDTIWRISLVCWISKATRSRIHINIYPNTYCFSTSTIIRERTSVYVIRALPVLLLLNLAVHKVTTRLYGVKDTLCGPDSYRLPYGPMTPPVKTAITFRFSRKGGRCRD